MTFNDSKGLLSKAKKLTEEAVSVYDRFLNDLKTSCIVPDVIVNDLKATYESSNRINMIDADAIYECEKNDIETTYMLIKEMAKRMLDNERRNTMPTCKTCITTYHVDNPLCRGCMRARDKESQRNYYTRNNLKIKNVIFNPPATIVFWEDNTKTVVKAVNEVYDPEKGLAMAFMKKAMGNQGNYFNTVKKWTEKYEGPVLKFDGGEMGLEAQKAFGIDLSRIPLMAKKMMSNGDNTK